MIKPAMFLFFWFLGSALIGGWLFNNQQKDAVLGAFFLITTFCGMTAGALIVAQIWRAQQ